MLGRIVVRLFAVVLDVVGGLIVLGGPLFGAYYASANSGVFGALGSVPSWTHAMLGLVAGFVASLLCVVMLFGVPFLIVEIHKNLLRATTDEHPLVKSEIPLTPDLV